MSFWDVVWFIFISFAFVAYLMVMFSILTDLFRDRDVPGFAKAVWVVALIFLPFITSLIYLIVRGKGMADRAGKSQTAWPQDDAYARTRAAEPTPVEQIAQARTMLDSGAITQSEYEALKARALGTKALV